MTDQRTPQPIKPEQNEELREFALIVHRALKMVIVFIEKKYQIGDQAPEKKRAA